jgi:hypothetical protein
VSNERAKHQAAHELGKRLAKDKENWQQEILSGATREHKYDVPLEIACVYEKKTQENGFTWHCLEVLSGLPPGMKDPGARGVSLERAKWRLRWAIASYLMDRKRKNRVDPDKAREFVKRANFYLAEK